MPALGEDDDHGDDGDARRPRLRPDPIWRPADAVAVDVVTTIPADTKVIGVPTFADGPVAMGAAGYRFGDDWRLGLVTMAVFFVVAVFVVLLFWPF